MKKQNGFTLCELIVVMAVSSILASMTLTALSGLKQQACIIECRSNLRQLGIAFHMYVLDHKGALPHPDKNSDETKNTCWFDRIDVYLGESNLHTIKQCPAWEHYSKYKDTPDQHSIKMNGALGSPERPYTNKRYLTFYDRTPSHIVLLVDGRTDYPFYKYTDTSIKRPYKDIANRHNGGANLLFLDGSTQYVPAIQQGIATESIGWHQPSDFIWHTKK